MSIENPGEELNNSQKATEVDYTGVIETMSKMKSGEIEKAKAERRYVYWEGINSEKLDKEDLEAFSKFQNGKLTINELKQYRIEAGARLREIQDEEKRKSIIEFSAWLSEQLS